MHHPTDRITHTTAFVTPVMEHWLEREIAQWIHPLHKQRQKNGWRADIHISRYVNRWIERWVERWIERWEDI